MRKISILIVAIFTAFSINLKAQSNLTCNFLDKIEDGTLERKLDFKCAFIGFSSINEATTFCKKMSNSHSDIQSVECTGTDGKGSYFVDFKMKKAQDFQFYKGLAIKYGFSYFIVNGEKKEVASMN